MTFQLHLVWNILICGILPWVLLHLSDVMLSTPVQCIWQHQHSTLFSLHKNLTSVQTSEKRSYGIPVVGGRLTTSCNCTHLFSRPSSGQRHCPRKRGICPRRDPWRGYDDFDSEWCARAPLIRAGLPGLCSPPVTRGRWSPRESTPVRHRQAVANWVRTVYLILTEDWTDCSDAL